MEAAIPQGGTVLREMLNRESSEGHCYGFAASLLHLEEAFAAPNGAAIGLWVAEFISD
jgi:hypothetical protein